MTAAACLYVARGLVAAVAVWMVIHSVLSLRSGRRDDGARPPFGEGGGPAPPEPAAARSGATGVACRRPTGLAPRPPAWHRAGRGTPG
jgi:hypothetical protein